MLLPVLVFETSRSNLVSQRAVALAAAALLVPASVMAVNWIGWRTTTLSPGFGLHANLRYEGDVLREYSALMADAPARPAFADPERPQLRWWNIYVGPEVTRAEYEAFDSFGRQLPAAATGLCAAQLLDRPAARVDGSSRATHHRRAASGSSPSTRPGPRWSAGSTSRPGSCSPSASRSRKRVSPARSRSSCGSSRLSATSCRPTSRDITCRCPGSRAVAAACVVVTLRRSFDRLRAVPGTVEGRRAAPER